MSEIAFLICVERGRLESEGRLLIESLRQFGGRHAQAPVYVFAPRPGFAPAAASIATLESLGATFVDEPLALRFPELPTFNKVYVSAWAEQHLDHDTLAFVDSDSVFLGPPEELAPGGWSVALRPVDRRIAGSRGRGQNEPFWRKMYAELGVRGRPFVETAVGAIRIRAYWNSGLVAARREAGVLTAWRDALERLFDAGIVQKRWPQFMDQLSLAGATADLGDAVKVLPIAYNYPLRQRGALGGDGRELELEQIVHLHYRLLFHVPDGLAAASPGFDPAGERYRWLDARLPLEPLEPADG